MSTLPDGRIGRWGSRSYPLKSLTMKMESGCHGLPLLMAGTEGDRNKCIRINGGGDGRQNQSMRRNFLLSIVIVCAGTVLYEMMTTPSQALA